MDIEGMSVFKNFRDYFDDVKERLTDTHEDIMEKLNENKGDGLLPQLSMPDMSPDSANL